MQTTLIVKGNASTLSAQLRELQLRFAGIIPSGPEIQVAK